MSIDCSGEGGIRLWRGRNKQELVLDAGEGSGETDIQLSELAADPVFYVEGVEMSTPKQDVRVSIHCNDRERDAVVYTVVGIDAVKNRTAIDQRLSYVPLVRRSFEIQSAEDVRAAASEMSWAIHIFEPGAGPEAGAWVYSYEADGETEIDRQQGDASELDVQHEDQPEGHYAGWDDNPPWATDFMEGYVVDSMDIRGVRDAVVGIVGGKTVLETTEVDNYQRINNARYMAQVLGSNIEFKCPDADFANWGAHDELLEAYLCTNNDDDDHDDNPDNSDTAITGTVAQQDQDIADMARMRLAKFLPAGTPAGTISLEMESGDGQVRFFKTDKSHFWTTAGAGSSTSAAAVAADNLDLYVEGVQPGEVVLKLEYTGGDLTWFDKVKVTVVEVDVDVDSDNDNGTGAPERDDYEEAIEETAPGKVICYNGDDDDGNSQPDREQTGTVTGENDLVQMKISLEPNMSGSLELRAVSGGQYVRVWETATKGTQVTLPQSYTLGTDPLPETLYIEGYDPGEAKLALAYKDASGTEICHDTVVLTVARIDLAAKGHDFANPKTGNIDVPEATENTDGAYVHFNVDNDDDSGGGTSKYPGGDFLETGPLSGENDLKLLVATFEPTTVNSGRIVLRRSNANVQVWSGATKGAADAIITGGTYAADTEGNGKKTWNLPGDWAAFNAVRTSLWVEGRDAGSATVSLSFEIGGEEVCSDTVKYTLIAAMCGDQPAVPRRNIFNGAFPELVNCEWSITDHTTGTAYNCIAWSVGETGYWYNPRDIDINYGDNDGIFEDSDMDAFYLAKKGWQPTASGASDAEAIYWRYPTDWDYTHSPLNPPSTGYHGAKKEAGCACGNGKWHMFGSKCGQLERIEHVWDQLEGSGYGSSYRFYK